jgi:hypothetical protein
MNQTSLEESFNKISDLFSRYSLPEVLTSLFVSSIWLPNISSPVKHLFFYSILASLDPKKFATSDSIKNHDDFRLFLQQLYSLSPQFPTIEDYVPEPDWGEVKFSLDEENFKIFYGNELENIYDILSQFQILYGSHDKEFQDYEGRSPIEELKCCLQIQNQIISRINQRATKNITQKLVPGYLEIPTNSFWEKTSEFYTKFTLPQKIGKSFIKRFTAKIGCPKKDFIKGNNFVDSYFTGKSLPFLFLSEGRRIFPVLPRRYSAILIDDWEKVFNHICRKLEEKEVHYSLRIGAPLHQYIEKRIRTKGLFQFVSAITPENFPHEAMFSSAIISRNKLLLLYVVDPCDLTKEKFDLACISSKLNAALKLISSQPVTLALHLDRKTVVFEESSNGKHLKPEILIVIPQVSTRYISIAVPKELPCTVVFMPHFLGIIDELDDVDQLAAFIEYSATHANHLLPISSLLDIFGSFKDSYGVLVGGAIEPDSIHLDPHWGSNMRYESLAKFWKIYPEVNFFDEPRSWNVTQETPTRTRLIARGYFGSAIYVRLDQMNVFLTGPFDVISYDQGLVADFLMQVTEDLLSRFKYVILAHKFFETYYRLHVNYFPEELASDNEKFKHLLHLKTDGKIWCLDIGFIRKGIPAIRIVFNVDAVRQGFMNAIDSSLEIDLLLDILSKLDALIPESKLESLRSELIATKTAKPRFKMFDYQKKACFPEFIQGCEPCLGHFKLAKKRIANLASNLRIVPGQYKISEAKKTIDALRDSVIYEINSEVAKYDFTKSIPCLLTCTDALTHKYETSRARVAFSVEHEVDYDRTQVSAKEHTEYLRTHKNCRYLIEKFVQLQPIGKQILEREDFQYLAALIDWLQVFYQASDNIHYQIITPVRVTINDDYLVDIHYNSDIDKKQKIFAEENSRLDLRLIGNPADRVDSPRSIEDFLAALDRAFKVDLGFGLRTMVNVLQVLSYWAAYGKVEENSYYSATREEIKRVCVENIIDVEPEEIEPILNFLTLSSHDVIHVLGQKEPCTDLPVWEHRKRYARYTLRPLLLVREKYFWGPYSTMKTGVVWSGSASSGSLPIDLQSSNIQKVVESEKKLIEDALVSKAFEIVSRQTKYVRKKLYLHKVNDSYPTNLGDYDVLAYMPSYNYIINLECKDILPPYCLKDAKRLKEKIFGMNNKDRGFFEKIIPRRLYLLGNLIPIAADLKWPINTINPPKIIDVFLSRMLYWWTRFPPKHTETIFLRVDQLSSYLSELEGSNMRKGT